MSSTKETSVSYEPKRWKTTDVTASATPTIETHGLLMLNVDGVDVIRWDAPDGFSYFLEPVNATIDKYLLARDVKGKPVMAYKPSSTGDGELVVSLEGAVSHACTLLHYEDDVPRKLYFAADDGTSNPLDRPAFILRAEGESKSPVARNSFYMVMCVAV